MYDAILQMADYTTGILDVSFTIREQPGGLNTIQLLSGGIPKEFHEFFVDFEDFLLTYHPEQAKIERYDSDIMQKRSGSNCKKIHRRKECMSETIQDRVVKIKVIGVGGAGNNVINRMIEIRCQRRGICGREYG